MAVALTLNCAVDDSGAQDSSTIYMFRVDYTSQEFEGGITLTFEHATLAPQTEIPVEIERTEPSQTDDGNLIIVYTPTRDNIFEGALTNNGNGNINFPGFIAPSQFATIEEDLPVPTGGFQSIVGNYTQAQLEAIWPAISNLGLTQFAVDENAVAALYLYQPNADPAFSANWDWMIMLYNQ